MMPNEIPELPLPHRDFRNDEELWAMYDEIGKVIQKFVGCTEKLCPVGSIGQFKVCDECQRLHNAIYTDPWCVDHG
jgi:hypothetical protein